MMSSAAARRAARRAAWHDSLRVLRVAVQRYKRLHRSLTFLLYIVPCGRFNRLPFRIQSIGLFRTVLW